MQVRRFEEQRHVEYFLRSDAEGLEAALADCAECWATLVRELIVLPIPPPAWQELHVHLLTLAGDARLRHGPLGSDNPARVDVRCYFPWVESRMVELYPQNDMPREQWQACITDFIVDFATTILRGAQVAFAGPPLNHHILSASISGSGDISPFEIPVSKLLGGELPLLTRS